MLFISGVLDQDAPDIVLESNPKLYARGRESRVYKPYSFWLNMLDALYQSLVLFFISYGSYYNSDVGLYEFGTTLMTSCLCVMLLHQAVETKSWVITFEIKNIHLCPIHLPVQILFGHVQYILYAVQYFFTAIKI